MQTDHCTIPFGSIEFPANLRGGVGREKAEVEVGALVVLTS